MWRDPPKTFCSVYIRATPLIIKKIAILIQTPTWSFSWMTMFQLCLLWLFHSLTQCSYHWATGTLYSEYNQQWNVFSAFNPSKCTLGAVGSRYCGWGFGALLKGLTSVVDNSCRSRDSNPQPRVKSDALSIRATTGLLYYYWQFNYVQ